MLHFAIKNANSKIKSKNSLWAKNKKYGLHRCGNNRKISASVQIKKPHLPVFMLKIDKCGEI